MQPSTLLAVLLLLGLLLLWRAKKGHRRSAGRLVALTVLGAVFCGVMPVSNWLILPLEKHYPPLATLPDRVDGIIVLAGSTNLEVSAAHGQVSLNHRAERLTEAVHLARRYPEARLVFSGGVGHTVTEADLARRFFADQGIAADRLTFDSQSRHSWDHARNILKLVRPAEDATWLLVTTASHMPRAWGVFAHAGWCITPYPVDYRTTGQLSLRPGLMFANNLSALDSAIRKWAALFYYRLAGHIGSFVPTPEKSRPCHGG